MNSTAYEQLEQIYMWHLAYPNNWNDLADKFIHDANAKTLMIDVGIIMEHIEVSIDEHSKDYKVNAVVNTGKLDSLTSIANIFTVTRTELIFSYTWTTTVYYRIYLDELVRNKDSCWFIHSCDGTLKESFGGIIR
jgi:hypothetical protein